MPRVLYQAIARLKPNLSLLFDILRVSGISVYTYRFLFLITNLSDQLFEFIIINNNILKSALDLKIINSLV